MSDRIMPGSGFHPFIDDVAGRYDLSPLEQQFLHGASIRSIKQLRRFLQFSPGFHAAKDRLDQKIRVNALLDAADMSTDRIFDPMRDGKFWKSMPLGALAPAADTVANIGTVPIMGGLQRELTPDAMLHGERRFRLGPEELVYKWAPRDQSGRNTCVAFAATACVEYALSTQGENIQDVDLSEEFIYRRMRDLPLDNMPPDQVPPGYKDGATKLGMAKRVLESQGICRESEWKYGSDAANLTNVDLAASAASRQQAMNFYEDWPDPKKRPAGIARMLLNQLTCSRKPVAIAFPIFQGGPGLPTNWELGRVMDNGIVNTPPPTWVAADMGHAVSVIGFQPDPHDHVGGYFEFRNSMGENFAKKPDLNAPGDHKPETPAMGYGLISATYVDSYCWEMLGYKC